MERYSFLRTLADSWMLVGLVAVFIGVILFLWRPGARKEQQDAAESIFQNEDRPAPDPENKDPDPDNKDTDEGE